VSGHSEGSVVMETQLHGMVQKCLGGIWGAGIDPDCLPASQEVLVMIMSFIFYLWVT
jgi:hypothetical protein